MSRKMVVGLILSLLITLIAFAWLVPPPVHAFNEGDIVCFKLTNERGIVTHKYGGKVYNVRRVDYDTRQYNEFELQLCEGSDVTQ